MKPSQNGTKVVTGKVRGSYVNVFRPKLNDLSGQMEYSMCLLIPKSDKATIKALRDAAEEAANKKWGDKRPAKFSTTLRDGDDPSEDKSSDPAYKGHYFVNVKSKEPPGIVDASRQPVLDAGGFVSGDYCRCSLNAYAYSQKGNNGVGFGLNNIQVVAKGESLTGRVAAEDEFDAVETEADEEVVL